MRTDTSSCLKTRGRVLNFLFSRVVLTRLESNNSDLSAQIFGGESTTPTQETELYREASRYIFG